MDGHATKWGVFNAHFQGAFTGRSYVEAACQRGMDIGTRSYGSVQSILRNGLDRAYRPDPKPDELSLQHGNIRGSGYYH